MRDRVRPRDIGMVDAPRARYVRRTREAPLSFSTKLYQGIGAIPDTVKNWVFNTFTLLYYNQILGMDAFLVSVALALAIVFHAITDPMAATLPDNSKTRWGRRHPFMLLASLPLAPALFAIFVPPSGLSSTGVFAWLLTLTVLTRGLMTLYHEPGKHQRAGSGRPRRSPR